MAEHLGVIGHDRLHPALGAIGPGQALRDTAQHVPAHGLPAETFGLGHADQARFAKIGNRFRRHHAGSFCVCGTGAQGRVQDLRAGIYIRRCL